MKNVVILKRVVISPSNGLFHFTKELNIIYIIGTKAHYEKNSKTTDLYIYNMLTHKYYIYNLLLIYSSLRCIFLHYILSRIVLDVRLLIIETDNPSSINLSNRLLKNNASLR